MGKDCSCLILTLLLLFLLFWFLTCEKVNEKTYLTFLLILIFGVLFLSSRYNQTKWLSLILLILLTFTLYCYFIVVFYSYKPIQNNSLPEWNRSMKEMLSEMYLVEVIGRKNYSKPVIYALLNNHNYSVLEHFSYGFLDPNACIVIRKGYFGIKGEDNNFIPVTFKGGNSESFFKGCQNKLDKGQSIIVFPEGKNCVKKRDKIYKWRRISPVQSGIFRLSLKQNVPIVPVIVEADLCPGFILFPGKLKIHLLPPLKPNDFNNYREMKEKYMEVMKEKLEQL